MMQCIDMLRIKNKNTWFFNGKIWFPKTRKNEKSMTRITKIDYDQQKP